MSESTASILVQIGSHAELSLKELEAVFSSPAVQQVHPQFARVALSSQIQSLSPQDIIKELGGAVKLLKSLQIFPLTVTNSDLTSAALKVLTSQDLPKITFGVGSFGVAEAVRLDGMSLKYVLQELDLRARWVTGPLTGLGAAVLSHHTNVIELVTIKTDKGIELAQTLAVQDINEWTLKDRGKPYADHTKGMLPPKVARIMLNLALGNWETRSLSNTVLLDPFCGSGTILAEALVSGVGRVIGSDVDTAAITGTEQNLGWLAETFTLAGTWQVMTIDATHIDERLTANSVTHIVTEPFLGKQTPQPHQIKPVLKGLQKLYLGAFKAWTQIVTDQAQIVIVFPHFGSTQSSQETHFGDLIDKISQFGYTPLSLPITYSRPGATTQRHIWHFRYTKP